MSSINFASQSPNSESPTASSKSMTSDVSSLYFCDWIKPTILGMEAGIYKVAPNA